MRTPKKMTRPTRGSASLGLLRFGHPIMLCKLTHCKYCNESLHRKKQLASIINNDRADRNKMLTLSTFIFAKRWIRCNIAHRTCVCVCACVRVCACVCACMHVCLWACVHECVCVSECLIYHIQHDISHCI